MAGAVFDATKSYLISFGIGVFAMLVSFACMWALGVRRDPKETWTSEEVKRQIET